MDSDINIGARIVGAIICIVIGGISANITIETYNEMNDDEEYEELMNYLFRVNGEEVVVSQSKLKYFQNEESNYRIMREPIEWVAEYNQSNRFAILYSSVFVFCVSLCCFTYICVKK
jgi:hypothetical protein